MTRSTPDLPTRPVRFSRGLIGLATTLRREVNDRLRLRGHDLGVAGTHVIPNLPEAGLGLTELASRLRVSLQRTGKLVRELEAAGYLQRVADDRDGRAKRVVYTRKGRRLIGEIDDIMEEVVGEFAEAIGKRRFERFCRDLGDLDEAVNGDGPGLVIGSR